MAVYCHGSEYGSCRNVVWLFAAMDQSMAAAGMWCGCLPPWCRVWQLQGCGVAVCCHGAEYGNCRGVAVCCHCAEYDSCRDVVLLFAAMVQSMTAAGM